MQIARKKVPEFKKLFKQRRENILEGRINTLLKKKQHALGTANRWGLKRKEKLTEDIVCYALWQTKEDIVRGLAKQRPNAAKINVLKAELNFGNKLWIRKAIVIVFFP